MQARFKSHAKVLNLKPQRQSKAEGKCQEWTKKAGLDIGNIEFHSFSPRLELNIQFCLFFAFYPPPRRRLWRSANKLNINNLIKAASQEKLK
jgi:hypothetical protein